jgi:M6 family metalloprotease-like protein
VQWIAGTGKGSATVTYPALPTATGREARFRLTIPSEGRASGACQLNPRGDHLTLGPTDLTSNLEATAPHNAVVLFMDFSDAPSMETPESLMNQAVRPGLTLLDEISYGRTKISVTAVPRWYRSPLPSARLQSGIVVHAMQLADRDVDFSPYDIVYLFWPSAVDSFSYAFEDGGTTFDGVRVAKNGALFGRDARTYGAGVFAHETGHIFGLPDLYRLEEAGGSPYPSNPVRDVGFWSLMSNPYYPAHTFAWEKRKLGYLDESQVDCLEGTGGEEAVLQPVEVPGGLKAIALPLDESRALVIEVRGRYGIDTKLCARGVLIYEVDASAPSGAGPTPGGAAPARIRGSRLTTSGPLFTRCGPWADATYGVGPGEISSFNDPRFGISVQILAAESNGAYRVRVTRE